MKVLHAPENIAGQAAILAKAQRNLGIEADVLVFKENTAGYPCDINLSISGKSQAEIRRLLVMNFVKCFFKYDLFHFHFGWTLLPRRLDLRVLKVFGKKIVMHYWGSDIRQSDVAMDIVYSRSPAEILSIYPEKENQKKRDRIAEAAKYADLTLVSDYPLLEYSPDSKVLRPAVEIARLPYVGGSSRRENVRIVHAPTKRQTKGTHYVIAAIEQLKAEGYRVDFNLLENMTNEQTIEMCRDVDIVVDQVLLESHGIFAVECMALGKPVLCRVDEKFLNCYPGLPLVRTDPDNICDNLKLLIERPDLRRETGEKGRKYVEEFHDSRKIARQLLRLYADL